jgi:hypothetical protein
VGIGGRIRRGFRRAKMVDVLYICVRKKPMKSVEIILRRRGGRMREKDRGAESN